MTTRLMPPAAGGSITVHGRTYTVAAGATVDVPDQDAFVMLANGWTSLGSGVGATAARPANPARAQTFHDTTLGYIITFDGKVWRNPSGTAV